MKPIKLALLAIFRNEGNIIKEWLKHYIKMEFDNIYLLDNYSNDNWQDDEDIKKIIKESNIFIKKTENNIQNSQINEYNFILNKIKKENDWLFICDLDEFLYSKKNLNLKEYISDKDCHQIVFPWLIFKPLMFEPKSIIKDSIYRIKFNDDEKCSKCKSIFNLKKLDKLDIHISFVNGKTIISDGKSTVIDCKNIRGLHNIKYNENEINNFDFVINHYKFRSMEYFWKVKINRIEVGKKIKSTNFTKNRNLKGLKKIFKKKTIIDKNLSNKTNYNFKHFLKLKFPSTSKDLIYLKSIIILRKFFDNLSN